MTFLNCTVDPELWGSVRLVENLENLEEWLHLARSGLYNNWAQLFIESRVGAMYHQITVIAFFFGFAVSQCK